MPVRRSAAGAAVMLLLASCRAGSGPTPVTHPSPGLSPEDIAALPHDLPSVGAEEVQRKRAFGEDVLLVDVRGPEEHARLRIPGSLHLPHYELQARQAELPRGRTLVLYCGGGDCPLSRWAVKKLREWGFTNAYELRGGVEGWKSRGLPTETGR